MSSQKEHSVLTPLTSLEFTRRNFDDPALEWRRLFSEILGTFLLVLVGAGGGVVNAVSNGQISRAAAVTAPGLMVLAIILFMGGISGAHLNPAVSIAFATRGNFPWLRVPGYIIAQLIGSTLAAESRADLGVRGGCIHYSRRALVKPDQWGIHESGAFVRPGPGAVELFQLLGVPRGSDRGCARCGRHRLHPAG